MITDDVHQKLPLLEIDDILIVVTCPALYLSFLITLDTLPANPHYMLTKEVKVDTHEIAREVIDKSGISQGKFAEKSGISYGTIRDQLRALREPSSTVTAYWNAATWIQERNGVLFNEAFLGYEPDLDTFQGLLEQAETLEKDIHIINDRVRTSFKDRDWDIQETQETLDLIDYLTRAARLLRLKQAVFKARIETQGENKQ